MRTAAPPAPWARPLALCVGLLTFAVAGCEAGEAVVPGLPGWSTAGAAERPWRLEAPPGELPDVEARRVWTEASPVGAVSPDGRFYAGQVPPAQVGIRSRNFRLIDLNDGSVEVVLGGPEEDPPVYRLSPALSPDGRRVAYESGSQRWKLWVREGLPGSTIAADTNEERGR